LVGKQAKIHFLDSIVWFENALCLIGNLFGDRYFFEDEALNNDSSELHSGIQELPARKARMAL
jgi:hypothetical protein